jgi:hypothetical protein
VLGHIDAMRAHREAGAGGAETVAQGEDERLVGVAIGPPQTVVEVGPSERGARAGRKEGE